MKKQSKIKLFKKELEKHKKPPSDDPYDNRVTHCYLKYVHTDGKEHIFEVRGWAKKIENDELRISVVNWTLCAGTATLYLKEEIADSYRIAKTWDG